MAETEYMIRSFGYVKSTADLEKVVLKVSDDGTPVTIGDVARVVEGPAIRRGITELNGEGEAVGGICRHAARRKRSYASFKMSRNGLSL
jgi:Cu(I)/Ag(I) efflux system membrane protein CusA/SilA